MQLVNHFKGLQSLRRPQPTPDPGDAAMPDLKDIKGHGRPSARSRSPPPAGTIS
jgi:hypothetical protein